MVLRGGEKERALSLINFLRTEKSVTSSALRHQFRLRPTLHPFRAPSPSGYASVSVTVCLRLRVCLSYCLFTVRRLSLRLYSLVTRLSLLLSSDVYTSISATVFLWLQVCFCYCLLTALRLSLQLSSVDCTSVSAIVFLRLGVCLCYCLLSVTRLALLLFFYGYTSVSATIFCRLHVCFCCCPLPLYILSNQYFEYKIQF